MSLRTFLCSVSVAIGTLSFAALAEEIPAAVLDVPASVLPSATWTSNTGNDASRHTRNCSVFPLRTGVYPFFFLERRAALMSLEGGDVMPLELKFQVDANPALDGGVLETPQKTVDALIAQIRANGATLRVSRQLLVGNKFDTVVDEIPLQGAIEQFDKCKAWLAH